MRGNFVINRTGSLNPNYKHGLKRTRLFSIWSNMKSRCYNQNIKSYSHYGARGITMCDEWKNDFKSFYDWSMSNGYKDDLTIDRIDVNGNYEPSNCRWATIKEQSLNKSTNRVYEVNKQSKPLCKWCEIYNKNYKTIQDRLKRGWSIELALTKEIQTKFRYDYRGPVDKGIWNVFPVEEPKDHNFYIGEEVDPEEYKAYILQLGNFLAALDK